MKDARSPLRRWTPTWLKRIWRAAGGRMRDLLPSRRHHLGLTIVWQSAGAGRVVMELGIGRYPRRWPRVGEVFAEGHKSGSAMEGIIYDGGVLISLLLQEGYTPEGLATHLGVLPDGGSISPMGAMVRAAAAIEEDEPVSTAGPDLSERRQPAETAS